MSLRQVFCALFLLGLLLHAHASNARKDALRRKLSSSFLETKAKYFPQQPIETLIDNQFEQQSYETPQYLPQDQSQSQSQLLQPARLLQAPVQQQQQQQAAPVPTQAVNENDRFAQRDETETETETETDNKLPSLSSVGKMIGNVASIAVNGPNTGQPAGSNGRVTGAAGRVSNSDSSCVACQFFVQTMTNSMTKYSTLFASMPTPTSQNAVTSFPPYYNPAAYRPPLLPYGGSYGNAVMNPFTRIGMIEEKSKIKKEKDNELPQPDKAGNPPQYGTPRRYRAADMTLWRDRLNRIDTVNPPNPDPLREQARYLESQMFSAVYQNFEGLCASRVPELFVPFCQPMLDKFHIIAEGLHYGDRPDQICMRNDFCAADSYIRKLPHAVFNPHNPV